MGPPQAELGAASLTPAPHSMGVPQPGSSGRWGQLGGSMGQWGGGRRTGSAWGEHLAPAVCGAPPNLRASAWLGESPARCTCPMQALCCLMDTPARRRPPDMQEQPLTVSLYSPRPVPEPRADAVPPLAHRHPLLPQQHLPHPAETPQVARGPAALRDPQRHPGHHPRPLQPGLPHPGRQQPAGPALDRAGQQRGEGMGTAPPAWGPFGRGSQQPPNLSPWLRREVGATRG